MVLEQHNNLLPFAMLRVPWKHFDDGGGSERVTMVDRHFCSFVGFQIVARSTKKDTGANFLRNLLTQTSNWILESSQDFVNQDFYFL
jgi:hypothetical protein